jgi:hypothetical protein
VCSRTSKDRLIEPPFEWGLKGIREITFPDSLRSLRGHVGRSVAIRGQSSQNSGGCDSTRAHLGSEVHTLTEMNKSRWRDCWRLNRGKCMQSFADKRPWLTSPRKRIIDFVQRWRRRYYATLPHLLILTSTFNAVVVEAEQTAVVSDPAILGLVTNACESGSAAPDLNIAEFDFKDQQPQDARHATKTRFRKQVLTGWIMSSGRDRWRMQAFSLRIGRLRVCSRCSIHNSAHFR